MADGATVHIGENSPEHVACKLLLDIASCEGKTLHSGTHAADRNYILTTYQQCLRVAKGLALKPT